MGPDFYFNWLPLGMVFAIGLFWIGGGAVVLFLVLRVLSGTKRLDEISTTLKLIEQHLRKPNL